MSYQNNPIFLCGAPRSGTTMLHSLLDGHSEILSIPIENHIIDRYMKQSFQNKAELFHYFYRDYVYNFDVAIFSNPDYLDFLKRRAKARFGEQTQTPTFDELSQIKLTAFIDAYQCELLRIQKEKNTFSLDMPYKALTKAIAVTFLSNESYKYFLHRRNTANEANAIRLKEVFPQAKFIHILRDPRTRYLSAKSRDISKTKWGYRFCPSVGTNDFATHRAKVSLYSFELAKRNKAILKDDYLIIRHEDLIDNREAVMQRIAEFIGVSFEPTLLHPTIMMGKTADVNSSFKEDSKKLSKEIHKRLQKYEANTSYLEQFLMNFYCARIATEFGYEGFVLNEKVNLKNALYPMKYEHFKDYVKNRMALRRLNDNHIWNTNLVIESFQELVEKGIEVKM